MLVLYQTGLLLNHSVLFSPLLANPVFWIHVVLSLDLRIKSNSGF